MNVEDENFDLTEYLSDEEGLADTAQAQARDDVEQSKVVPS